MVKEQKAFQLMLASLRAEAVSNSSVISKGYDEFFPGGVVLREFRTATAQALLANPVFMKYSNQEHVEHINRYVNDSALANNYRRVLEDLTFKTPKRSPWLDTVDGFIEEHLKLVKSGIAVVSKLGL